MGNRGQNINALLGQRGQDIGQRDTEIGALLGARTATANNMTQANIANANIGMQGMNNMNNWNAQRMAAELQSRGMDSDNAYRSAMGNNQFGLDRAGMENQFNMNMFGQQSQNALGQGQLGLGLQGLIQGGNQNMLNQMFGSFNQSNGIGSPQAQTIQTPNDFQQFMNFAQGVTGIGAGLSGMGMFGNRSPASGTQGFQNFNWNNPSMNGLGITPMNGGMSNVRSQGMSMGGANFNPMMNPMGFGMSGGNGAMFNPAMTNMNWYGGG